MAFDISNGSVGAAVLAEVTLITESGHERKSVATPGPGGDLVDDDEPGTPVLGYLVWRVSA